MTDNPIIQALRAARAFIDTDLRSMIDMHMGPDNELDDDGHAAAAEYREVLEQIDAGLEHAQAQAEPVAHFGSAHVNANGVHITTVLGPVAIPIDAKIYLAPQPAEQARSGPLTDVQLDPLRRRIETDPVFALSLLQRAGIATATGELSARFGGPGADEEGGAA